MINKIIHSLEEIVGIFIITSLLVFLVFLVVLPQIPFFAADSDWYVKMADGKFSDIIKPFSERILHPFLVGALSSLGGVDIHTSFLTIGLASLFIFIFIILLISQKANKNIFIAFPFIFSPFIFILFKDYYLPDIFYGALISVFFYFLFKENFLISVIVLFFLALSRLEMTILLALPLFIFSIVKFKKTIAIAIVFLLIFASIILSYFGSLGKPNMHNLPDAVYVAVKFPVNFLKNVFGINLWTNTFSGLTGTCIPKSVLILPSWLQYGSVKSVGICGFSLSRPFKTLSIMISIFGLAPLIIFLFIIKNFKKIFSFNSLWISVAVIYSALVFIIGPGGGTGVSRIVGYAWPAFLLVAPFILNNYYKKDAKSAKKIIVAHSLLLWIPLVLVFFGFDGIKENTIIILIGFMVYIFAYFRIKKLNYFLN